MEKGFCKIKSDKLVECDWNYKKGLDELTAEQEEAKMAALEENFKRNGQVENIIVRELDTGFFEVVNGNHRLRVAKRIDMKELYCFNLGNVSVQHAIRVAIETNETKFESDQIELAKRMKEIEDAFGRDELLKTMPFDDAEFDRFETLLNFNMDDYQDEGSGGSGGSSDGSSDFKVLKYDLPLAVAEQLEDQVDRFKKILYPNDKPSNVSYIMPIEAMIQALAQIPDSQITGE